MFTARRMQSESIADAFPQALVRELSMETRVSTLLHGEYAWRKEPEFVNFNPLATVGAYRRLEILRDTESAFRRPAQFGFLTRRAPIGAAKIISIFIPINLS